MHRPVLPTASFPSVIEQIEKDSGFECAVILIAIPIGGGHPDLLSNVPPDRLYDILEWMVDHQDNVAVSTHAVEAGSKLH